MQAPTYTLEGLRGVGRVELTLCPEQRVYVFLGANGVGKTKCLEGLFRDYLFANTAFRQINSQPSFVPAHDLPVVFLGAGKRGHIESISVNSELLGDFKSRQRKYFDRLVLGMQHDFSNLGMDMGLEQWIVSIAHSANPFQVSEDNRQIEIKTLLQLLKQVDERFDAAFLSIDGNNQVSIKVDGVATEIRNLSTGFASLLKIFQTIVSGYGFFTNETKLAEVKGMVFIDEIESHLHTQWQSKIIPLLKNLFPNTTFFVATHSPIVLSQLREGEAYRLEKQADGVVRSTMIEAPNKRVLSDVLADAMGVDLNQLKVQSLEQNSQEDAKKALLTFLQAKKAARQQECA